MEVTSDAFGESIHFTTLASEPCWHCSTIAKACHQLVRFQYGQEIRATVAALEPAFTSDAFNIVAPLSSMVGGRSERIFWKLKPNRFLSNSLRLAFWFLAIYNIKVVQPMDFLIAHVLPNIDQEELNLLPTPRPTHFWR